MLYRMALQHQENEKWGTAALYRAVASSISIFMRNKNIEFNDITPAWLKSFENYLLSTRKTWNTISTYMRILRASYNQAVMANLTSFRPYLFNKVYMGVIAERENALDVNEMKMLIGLSVSNKSMLTGKQLKSLQYFVLMFLLKGLPFVDLAYLKKTDLKNGTLSYRRKKTGRHLRTKLDEMATQLLQSLMSKDKDSPYLFDILHYPEGSKEAYKEYQASLKQLNKILKVISKQLGLNRAITTYCARHTWATFAFRSNINPAVISQSMGHSSIKVTETYLKPFQQEIINEANRQVLQFVMEGQDAPFTTK